MAQIGCFADKRADITAVLGHCTAAKQGRPGTGNKSIKTTHFCFTPCPALKVNIFILGRSFSGLANIILRQKWNLCQYLLLVKEQVCLIGKVSKHTWLPLLTIKLCGTLMETRSRDMALFVGMKGCVPGALKLVFVVNAMSCFAQERQQPQVGTAHASRS